MVLKLLNKEELIHLYNGEMVFDFPKTELKPVKSMLKLMDMGYYEPLLVEENGEAVGYAMVWVTENRQGGLLEYFAVLRGKRSRGIGGRILAVLGQRYGQIFGEAEAPVSDDPEENDLRRRRIDFYLRNGLRKLDYDCALFGVHFNCLYLGPETDDRKIERLHKGVYESYFSPGHMERFVQFPLRPGERVNPAPEWVEEDSFPL